jgi:ribosome-binding factor A
MSRRADRLGGLLQQEISRIVSERLRDPRLEGLLTVTRVELSADLQQADVFVSFMGGVQERQEAIRGMESAVGYLRRELGRRLHLKLVPRLRFMLDNSLEEGSKMLSLLERTRSREAGSRD